MTPLVRSLIVALVLLAAPWSSASAEVAVPCGATAAMSSPAVPDQPDDAAHRVDDLRAGRAASGMSRSGRAMRAAHAADVTTGGEARAETPPAAKRRPSVAPPTDQARLMASADPARRGQPRAPPPA